MDAKFPGNPLPRVHHRDAASGFGEGLLISKTGADGPRGKKERVISWNLTLFACDGFNRDLSEVPVVENNQLIGRA